MAFDDCKVDLTNWRQARLEAAVFVGCKLAGADFTDADLRGATFVRCDLSGAQFHHATMTGTRFRACEFEGIGGITSWDGAIVHLDDLLGLAHVLAGALGIKVARPANSACACVSDMDGVSARPNPRRGAVASLSRVRCKWLAVRLSRKYSLAVFKVAELLAPARLGGSFRWLLASSWTTNLGDGVAAAAGPLLVASLTDDPFLISLAALLRWAPPLLFGLYAGVVSDRHDRRRIVMLADGSRALVLAMVVVALVAGRLDAASALVALGLLATAEVFADNTASTLTPMLVPREDLALANARLQFGFLSLNQLVGPPIGAALFAAGRVWPFVTQAVLVGAGVLLVFRVRPPAGETPVRTNAVRLIREGLAWTLRHAAVRTLVLTILIFNVTFGAAWSVLVLYARDQLGLGAIGFGLLSTVSAIGGLLGTGLYGWITTRVSLGNVMRAGLIIETFTHLALAVTTSPAVALLIFFVFGAHAFVWGTTSITVRQRAVPSALQGRVASVNTIGVFGGLVVGSALGGTLAAHFGVTAPFWFAFLGSAVFLVLLWPQLTKIAHADEQPAPRQFPA